MEKLKTKPLIEKKKDTSNRCRNEAMIMGKFTVKEINLICIYNTGSRAGLLAELSEMQTYLQKDETELLELTRLVISKVDAISDEDFDSKTSALVANFEE